MLCLFLGKWRTLIISWLLAQWLFNLNCCNFLNTSSSHINELFFFLFSRFIYHLCFHLFKTVFHCSNWFLMFTYKEYKHNSPTSLESKQLLFRIWDPIVMSVILCSLLESGWQSSVRLYMDPNKPKDPQNYKKYCFNVLTSEKSTWPFTCPEWVTKWNLLKWNICIFMDINYKYFAQLMHTDFIIYQAIYSRDRPW